MFGSRDGGGVVGGVDGVAWSGATGKRKKDTQDAFV